MVICLWHSKWNSRWLFITIVVIIFGHCVGGSCCNQDHDDHQMMMAVAPSTTSLRQLLHRTQRSWNGKLAHLRQSILIVTLTLRLLLKLLLPSQKVTANKPGQRAWHSFPTVWFLCAIWIWHYKFQRRLGGTPPVKRHWTNCSCKFYSFHCDLAWIWLHCTFDSSYSAKTYVVCCTSLFKLFIWSTFSEICQCCSKRSGRQCCIHFMHYLHYMHYSHYLDNAAPAACPPVGQGTSVLPEWVDCASVCY